MNLDLTACNARRKWASQHLAALREAVREYERSDPYPLVHTYTPSACVSELHFTPTTVPMEIGFRAGDVVHNLLSCLDNLVWQMTVATDNAALTFPLSDDPDGKKWRRLLFPLLPEEDQWSAWPPTSLWGLNDASQSLVQEVQPVAAADDPRDSTLWKLHELSNVDKHRMPLAVVPALVANGTPTITIPTGGVNSQIVDLLRVPAMCSFRTQSRGGTC